jgi:hypothetical protein
VLDEHERVGHVTAQAGLDQLVLQPHRLGIGESTEIADDQAPTVAGVRSG